MVHRHTTTCRRARAGRSQVMLGELTLILAAGMLSAVSALAENRTGVLLPDGREFVSWEEPLEFSRTYYVDNRNPKASDSNPGTKELSFLSINKAAQVLQPAARQARRASRGRGSRCRDRQRQQGLILAETGQGSEWSASPESR